MISDIKTLTGLTWKQVEEKMLARLPDEVYKPVEGRAGGTLTSVKSAYTNEVLTYCFGPFGIGWGYEYDESDLVVERLTEKRVRATVDRMIIWYKIVTGDGDSKQVQKIDIPCNGGSDNETHEFAVRGAITSAISSAARLLLFQLDLYKGLIKPGSAPKREAKRQSGSDRSGGRGGLANKTQLDTIRDIIEKIPGDNSDMIKIREDLKGYKQAGTLTVARASEYIKKLSALKNQVA